MEKTHMWISTLIESLSQIVFPTRASEVVVRQTTKLTPNYGTVHTPASVTIHYLASYKDPIVRATIHESKFHNNRHAQALLGALCTSWLHTQPTDSVIVPIPLSKQRYRSRGHNQVLSVLQHTDRTLTPTLLTRADRPAQTTLTKEERLHNLANSFYCRQPELVTGAHIVIFDDVVTTGSTFVAARAALAPHSPASITCVAIAH